MRLVLLTNILSIRYRCDGAFNETLIGLFDGRDPGGVKQP
jgi:hypothetical protein